MNYFFVFLIQTLLPISILLSCSWAHYPNANAKKLIWLSLFGFFIGNLVSLNLPATQSAKLSVTIIALCILLFAYFSQFIYWQKLNTSWHIMLRLSPAQTSLTPTFYFNSARSFWALFSALLSPVGYLFYFNNKKRQEKRPHFLFS